MIKRLTSRMMESSLRKGFRRICWVGPVPEFPENLPIVAYANHHTFYDGYVLWLLARKMLARDTMLWMEEWHKFPFFATVGAYPFPANDAKRRLTTIRQTAKRMSRDPNSFLIYFPEGELHPPEAGILPIEPQNMKRLDRIFPPKYWWPINIHMTTWGEDRPTLLLAGGVPHKKSTGREATALSEGLKYLKQSNHDCKITLLDGQKSQSEAWNMGFMANYFKRYL